MKEYSNGNRENGYERIFERTKWHLSEN